MWHYTHKYTSTGQFTIAQQTFSALDFFLKKAVSPVNLAFSSACREMHTQYTLWWCLVFNILNACYLIDVRDVLYKWITLFMMHGHVWCIYESTRSCRSQYSTTLTNTTHLVITVFFPFDRHDYSQEFLDILHDNLGHYNTMKCICIIGQYTSHTITNSICYCAYCTSIQ